MAAHVCMRACVYVPAHVGTQGNAILPVPPWAQCRMRACMRPAPPRRLIGCRTALGRSADRACERANARLSHLFRCPRMHCRPCGRAGRVATQFSRLRCCRPGSGCNWLVWGVAQEST
eukprot:365337-Chlamydomonas_euryale.AAC.2